jgi:starch synthase (maltosyl-transferring)
VALALGLDRTRWSPAVIALSGEGRLAQPLREAGIAVTCLGARRDRPIQALTHLVQAFRSRKPWLVQSFLFHANIATRLAGPWARRPWIVNGIRVAERAKAWHLTLERRTQRLATGSVCVSNGVRKFAEEAGRLDPRRLTVIPNGIDPQQFDQATAIPRATLGVPEDGVLAIFIGRIEMQKGLDFLLMAAETVLEQRPDWHLAIVGDGPDLPGWRLCVQRDPRLSRHVQLLGRRDDVPTLLKTADLLVLPSLWEGMPNVVLEAMAARRAVVATTVEGTEDLVVPGQTGWLVPPWDPKALAAALIEAAADRDRLTRFGEAGRQSVEVGFTQRNVIAAYESLWARVLGFSTESLKQAGPD